jgi:hypothetical protein
MSNFFANDKASNLEMKEYKASPICPAENLQAVIRGVFDIGYEVYNENVSEKLLVVFEVDEPMPAGEFEGLRFNLNKRFTKKINKDLTSDKLTDLTKLILACTNSDTISDNFALSDLVGLNCQLDVKHGVSTKGNKYAKINSITKKIKNAPMLGIEKPYTELPAWIAKIKQENLKNAPPAKDDDMPLQEDFTVDAPIGVNGRYNGEYAD